jgi:hypothetical protein
MWCLANDRGAVEEPLVEEISTPRLGTGMRVMRYRHDDNGALYAALRYAWRSEKFETDLMLNVTTDDLGRLSGAIPAIEDFIRAIEIIHQPPLDA